MEGRIDYDELWESDSEEDTARHDRLMGEYRNHDADEGEFVILQDPRGHDYCIAGIVHFITDSTRWNGTPSIGPVVMENPEPARVEAMEQIIDEDLNSIGVERKTEEPEHIVFTHNH